MSVLAAMFAVAAIGILAPLWAPLVLAAWFADLLRPAVRILERLLGGRRRAAGALAVLVTLCVLLPLLGIATAVASSLGELLGEVRWVLEGQGSLAGALLGADASAAHPSAPDWADLAARYGASAWRALSLIARASATVVLAALVFVAALYTFAVDGARAYDWLEAHAPVPRQAFVRLAGAFRETGRGLIIAGGGTALVQGALATAAYLAIGLPRALVLGPLTALCALVPVVGTGLVWAPLAIELGASGQYWRAGAVGAVGAGVLSLVDNFVRPALARHGHLELPTFVILISMLGGVATFGATGALLGPLVVRLCVEALAITAGRRNASETSQTERSQEHDERPVDAS